MRWFTPWLLLFALTPSAAVPDPSPSAQSIADHIRILSGEVPVDGAPIRSRNIHHPDHRRARAWLRTELEAIDGLMVWDESFDAEGETGLGNLVADLPGAIPTTPWIIVGAHFDSTASRTPDWRAETDPAPGADDDASGVSAVLAIAELLASELHEGNVRFVLFDAEEEGLIGSDLHAAAYGEADIALMLSLDPIGHNPGDAGYLWVSYDPRWPDASEALVATGDALGTPLVLQPIDGALLGANSQRSDHAPFWNAGHPALHLASFPQPPDYHEVSDTLDVVDTAFTAEVAALVHAHVSALAVPVTVADEPVPARSGCGR